MEYFCVCADLILCIVHNMTDMILGTSSKHSVQPRPAAGFDRVRHLRYNGGDDCRPAGRLCKEVPL